MQDTQPRRATSQSHGDTFEDTIKGEDRYRGAANHSRARRSPFDIEGRFDKRLHIPAQIKVSGNTTFPLADARRYWTIDEPFTKLLGHWVQDRHLKLIVAISEFIIHGGMLALLRGGTSAAEVGDCHEAIRALRHETCDSERERQRALIDDRIATMHERTTLLTFNPKYDDTNARLQISVTIGMLGRVATTEERFRCAAGVLHPNRCVHTTRFGTRMTLPHPIRSGRRRFLDGSGGGLAPAFNPEPDMLDRMWREEELAAEQTIERDGGDLAGKITPASCIGWGSDTLFGR